MKKYLVLFCLSGVAMATALAQTNPAAKLNVLFIAVDDLRPELGCYGVAGIKTPNIDALAKSGLRFNRAYCQQAVCSPSRTSLLTGRRPDTTKIYNLVDHFRQTIPEVVTLPQQFKNNGYFCQAFGKIYHMGLDDPPSWSAPSFGSGGDGSNKPEKTKKAARKAGGGRGPAWAAREVADNELVDGETADAALRAMNEIKDKPFFLAVGFHKPHLPFIAPKKYYDLYRTNDMRLAQNPFPPKDVFPLALTDWGELRSYDGVPKKGPIPEGMARELIRGYYAAVSYTDAQVGRLLEELQRLGLREKTIVILWGDHGWQLGEHGLWSKHTNFEIATHVPLLVSVPRQKSRGLKTDALVELVDVYPTLCELAGVPLSDGLEGKSFAPLLENPKRPWKAAAFSQYPRGKVMGYSIRTGRYRYTEWEEKDKTPVGMELYDHQKDPDENVNIVHLTANEKLVAKLSQQLHRGLEAALPEKKN